MGYLNGKVALIFGVANDRSIAWGIAQAFAREGAQLGLSYAGEALERRVRPLATQIGCDFIEPCDVASDEQIQNIAQKAAQHFGKVDILVHAIAFANREELNGPYYNTSRAGFHLAMDISVYSFTALARAFQPYIPSGGALLTLTYYGAEKVAPHYNVMALPKQLWKPRCAIWHMISGDNKCASMPFLPDQFAPLLPQEYPVLKTCTNAMPSLRRFIPMSPSKM